MQPGYSKASSNNLPAVDVLMVADFMKRSPLFVSSEQRGVKLARSSRENYGDSAVGYVQVKREEEKCYVMGKITPEHKIRDKPYSVSAVIDEEEGSVEEVSCHDCAASAGKRSS
ncbi:uncharacterized protein LOC124154049 [Ischnura elegans]|uniref:uncharacterized protein LOC124153162 n=1 Tax=Ischnura elegans TaxID=197161 RepID=UPI001ED8BA7D|nr:uncharacterized protein LOC124153162 [Ischnura elegans]XP_046383502.1 uncharacterized protein LOC124154049 [Ischnura elegans]